MSYKITKFIKIGNYVFPGVILALSLLSATDLCMGGCSGLSDYRLFGTHFAVGGSLYALLLIATVYATERVNKYHWATDLFVAAGIGAELWFISIQKFVAKTWCPICLTIAGILTAFALVRGLRAWLLRDPEAHARQSHGRWLLLQARNTAVVVLTIAVGFLVALTSTGRKHVELSDSAKALETASPVAVRQANPLSIKDIWSGKLNSPIEVYFVSDWYCGFCRKVDPIIKAALPEISKRVKYTWIDMAIHRESMNIIPVSLNVLMSDRKNYSKARSVLYNLTASGKVVSAETAQKALLAAGINAGELDLQAITGLFTDMVMFARIAEVNQTPSVIILNTETGVKQVLAGADNITRERLLKAVGVGNAGK